MPHVILLLREDIGLISEEPWIQVHIQEKISIKNLNQIMERK